MKNIVIDTDIFIDQLRGLDKAKSFLEDIKGSGCILYFSALTEPELISGKECNDREKRNRVLELLSLGIKVEVNNEIALKAGDFRRWYNISMADAIIGATAFSIKARLITRDMEHFKRVKEIETISPH